MNPNSVNVAVLTDGLTLPVSKKSADGSVAMFMAYIMKL